MDKLFFDLETTGTDTSKDRIIQLAIRIVDEDGKVLLNKAKLYNPGIQISESATAVHGYKDEDLKDMPSFKDDAAQLKKLFENRIIVMFNGMHFDIPLLMAEFERAGVNVELSGKFIDVLKIERQLAPHTLGATYKKYTGEKLEGSHDAMVDVMATETILAYQIRTMEMEAENDGKDFNRNEVLFEDTTGMADWGGKLKYDNEGFLIFNFGKVKGTRVLDDPKYASWILKENFSSQVKKLITKEQSRKLTKDAPSAKSTGFYTSLDTTSKFVPVFEDDLPF